MSECGDVLGGSAPVRIEMDFKAVINCIHGRILGLSTTEF